MLFISIGRNGRFLYLYTFDRYIFHDKSWLWLSVSIYVVTKAICYVVSFNIRVTEIGSYYYFLYFFIMKTSSDFIYL